MTVFAKNEERFYLIAQMWNKHNQHKYLLKSSEGKGKIIQTVLTKKVKERINHKLCHKLEKKLTCRLLEMKKSQSFDGKKLK